MDEQEKKVRASLHLLRVEPAPELLEASFDRAQARRQRRGNRGRLSRGPFVAAAVLGALVASVFGGYALGRSGSSAQPEYYTEGVRPTREPGREYLEGEGCVPYSPERPNVYICGEVPEGFAPGPPPGGFSDYPEICRLGYQAIATQWGESPSSYDLFSCFVAPTARLPGKIPEFLVNFAPREPGGGRLTVRVRIQ